MPIIVGSDAAAESDRYSAVTLAGVIGTDCVVLAGNRHGSSMPADQRARLGVAAAGGFVVGGTAAVPGTKTAGRIMFRLAGTDRWHTARLVGDQARRGATAGAGTPEAVSYVSAVTVPAHGDAIARLAQIGVLLGTDCAPRMFCADRPVRLRTLATWLVRLLESNDPPDPIKRLAEMGIITHCASGQQPCGDETVARDQMATFFARAFDLVKANTTRFVDVESGSSHHENISRLVATTIDPGCRYPSRFCPGDVVSRAQMANLLTRAIDWQEARAEVATNGFDDSVGLAVTYDEEEYEATASWSVPPATNGQVKHYVLQSRLILEDFGPKFYQIVETEDDKNS